MVPLTCVGRCARGAATLLLLPLLAQAQTAPDLTDLSFDDLLNLEITSVSKRAQPLSEAAAAVHQLVWGLGYRGVRTETRATPTGSVDFTNLTSHLWSGFLQGDFELLADRLRLVLGSKFEHNDFTGFEYQPNVRLLWKLSEQQVLWAAISRAVRTPSLGEQFVSLQTSTVPPTPPLLLQPAVVVAKGTTDFQTEHLWAYEIGFRINTAPDWSLDAALFLNDYDDLRTVESRPPVSSGVGPFLLLASPFANGGGRTGLRPGTGRRLAGAG